MNRTPRILQTFVSFLSAFAVWLIAATQALAADPPAPKPEESLTDYTLSYMVVIMGVVLGLLVVAKTSSRRDRDRTAGYVEKNLMADE
ncbi:MAG: hypothetical protein WCJ35_05225 [Planctomycetota bacterium]